jgi:hypothetical protein
MRRGTRWRAHAFRKFLTVVMLVSASLVVTALPAAAWVATFAYTGAAQTFVVPVGVTSITVECWGAAGGNDGGSNTVGAGGYLKATIAVTPGETLNLYVGGSGGTLNGGWNGGGNGGGTGTYGGGGGGASDVRRGGTALSNRVIVGGGGGGVGYMIPGNGGSGGGSTGVQGGGMGGGGGGSQTAGGAGVGAGTAGSFGNGGTGGISNPQTGGGGGGGYYGGGGGNNTMYSGGGGGGSSYSSGTIITNTQGVQSGSGHITLTYVAAPTTPTISNLPSSGTFGGGFTATVSTNGDGTKSVTSNSTGICTVASSVVVSYVGVGTCSLTAHVAAGVNYLAADGIAQTFSVGLANQTISITSTTPTGAVYNGTYTASATGGASGNPVVFTSGATGVCTATTGPSPVTFTFIATGTCIVDANQAGNADYNVAPQVQQSFTVALATQTISFTSTAPTGAVYNGTYTASATGGTSGNPVVFTSGATSVCTATMGPSPVTFTFIATGTCIVDANQTGNSQYNVAPQVQQSFAVGLAPQTISITSTAPSGATVGGGTYTATATATSTLPVTISLDGTSTACSLTSGLLRSSCHSLL